MEKKKDSLLKCRLKWKLFWGVVSILIFISPFLMILLLFAGIAPAAEESVVADYKTAAETVGCSWQELLAFDTVRYENDFDEADPFQSALEFMSVYYEEYRKVTVNKQDGSTETKWVLDKKGWLNSLDDIRGYFHLPADADAAAVVDAASGYTKPRYVISINTKDIEDVIEEECYFSP